MKTEKSVSINVNQMSKNIVCHRISWENLQGKNFVLVPEGWQVLVLQNGQLGKTVKRGLHKLSLLLKNKLQTELVFYPVFSEVAMLWGTAQKLKFNDVVFNLPIEIGTNGILNFKIKNIRKFYFSYGAFEQELKVEQIKQKLMPSIITCLQNAIKDYSQQQKQSFLTLNIQKAIDSASVEISYYLQNNFGISLSSITVSGVIFDKLQLKRLEQENEKIKRDKQIIQENQISKDLQKDLQKTDISYNEQQTNNFDELMRQTIQNQTQQEEEGLMLLL